MASSLVAITGVTGYVGSLLSGHLSRRGDEVVALTRRRPKHGSADWRHFDLGIPIDGSLFDGVDVMIHAAWDLSGRDTKKLWDINVVGSRALIEAAVAAGVPKIVFVSSMSAYFGTRQTYGLMKLAVERTVLDSGCIVVRPGLVYGPSPGGMAGTLSNVSRLTVWPRFKFAKLFMANEDDLAPAMVKVVESYGELAGNVLGFANPQPVDLSAILTYLSADHKRRPSLPVPPGLVMGPLRLAEKAGVKFPFRSDSLLGLVEGPAFLPGQQLLAENGIEFRGLDV